jgi:hypothetical protein
MKTKKPDGGPCCFCGEIVHCNGPDPTSVYVTTFEDNWQMWYCHWECFRQRLAPNMKIDMAKSQFT